MVAAARPRAVLVVRPDRAADLGLLDALCRTAAAARRCGLAVELRTPDDRLRALMVLCGLGEALGLSGCPGSGQVQRQAEPGEDRLAEEGVDVGDPPG